METFLLYKHFQRSPQVLSTRQELADFWLGFLLQACQPSVTTPHCPVRDPTELGPPHPCLDPQTPLGTTQQSGLTGRHQAAHWCQAGWENAGAGVWVGDPVSGGGLTPQPPTATGPGAGAQQGPAASSAGTAW